MKKTFVIVLAIVVGVLPAASEAAIDSLNGQTDAVQIMTTPGSNGTNSMHMKIVTRGTDEHRFRWDGTPWRTDQGGSGTTTFSNGGLLFYKNDMFTQSLDPNRVLVWDDLVGRLSIGATTSENGFEKVNLFIAGDTTTNAGLGAIIRNYTPSSFGSAIRLEAAGGSQAAPTAVSDNMTVGAFVFGGYNGTEFPITARAQMRAIAEEDWTETANGLGLAFTTTAPGGIVRTEKMRILGNGNIGIGTNSPEAGLDIQTGVPDVTFEKLMLSLSGETTSNSGLGMRIRNFTQSNFGSAIRLDAAGGTEDSPTALTEGMTVGAYAFSGFDGTDFTGPARAQMRGFAEEDWDSSNQGMGISFTTTAPGGTSRTEKMRITGNGNIGVGTNSPEAKLDVVSVGEVTTLKLDGDTGSCIIMADSDGSGYTYITANNGVLSASATPCN